MKASLPKLFVSILVIGSLSLATEATTKRFRNDIPLSFPQDKNKASLQGKWQFFLAPVSGNFWTITQMHAAGIRPFDTANRKANPSYQGCCFHDDSDTSVFNENRVVTFWPWGSKMDHVRVLWFNAVRFRD